MPKKMSGDHKQSPSPSKSTPGAGTLYIVATPIGNLKDITLRALDILKSVDAIACEDSRVTGRLLEAYGIRKSMLVYHEHSHQKILPKISALLDEGKSIALVSDAGTPLISDPGSELMKEAHQQGWNISTIPGPSSAIAALTLSGIPSDRFFFQGFLPEKSSARARILSDVKTIPAALIFFTPARKLTAFLEEANAALGDRSAAVVREITKHFEEVKRGNLSELLTYFATPPKGEIVVVIEGASENDSAKTSTEELDELLKNALKNHSLKEAVQLVQTLCNLSRKEIYSRALELNKLSS